MPDCFSSPKGCPLRCFIALPLPDPLTRALEPVLTALPVGRVVPAENLHLTLAFLGEQPDWQIEAVHEALSQISFPRFSLRLSGLDTFGEAKPHVVWAGIEKAEPVKALQAKVLGALHLAGLDLPRRRFRPHVTLARLDRLGPGEDEKLARVLGKHQSFPSPEAQIDSFVLYRSMLTKSDPVYEVLADYPLNCPKL